MNGPHSDDAAGDLSVGDDLLAAVRMLQDRVESLDLLDRPLRASRFNELTHVEGVKDDDQPPAGEVRQRSLQGEPDRQTRRPHIRHKRGGLHPSWPSAAMTTNVSRPKQIKFFVNGARVASTFAPYMECSITRATALAIHFPMMKISAAANSFNP